jgi:N-acetylmuramoyl-L-alanine amidase
MLLSTRVTAIPIERWVFACAFAALLGLAGACGASAATVATGWRAGDHGATTRFVLDLDGPAPFKVTAETGPDRLRIDLPGVEWQFGHQPGGAKPDGLIGAAEFSDPPGPGSHITLWLKGPARVNSANLVPPSEGYRYRLVVDLDASGAARPAPTQAAAALAKPAPHPASPPPPPPKQAVVPPPKPEPAPASARLPAPQMASAAPVSEPQPQPAAPPVVPAKEAPPPVPAPAPPSIAPQSAALPAAAPGPPLVLRAAGIAIEVPPPPPPMPAPARALPPPPSAAPSIQAALPPPMPRLRDEAPPPPRSAPLPRITSTPLPILVPPPPPAPPPPAPLVVPATAQLAVLAPIRIIREPGRPVMVVLPIPPKPVPPPKPVETRPLIALDPGHGGIDPGATGVSGVHEKAITLAFALELERQLEESGRYRVLLTRTEDSAVALRERVRIARAGQADLLLSIHADVLANRAISGLSVYTESETASDRETEALAAKENKADLIAGVDLSGAAPELANILLDLAQRETRNRSGVLAGELVQELASVAPLLPRTHRSAGFAVLTAPDVPSVLLELGYLSNKADERGLTSPDQRARLAAAILRALDRFFAGQPMLRRS